MAKTQLNLELLYKGKTLDYIKYGSGLFKKDWFIGSNKHLLWQVLLPSFPDKHKLISQKGNEHYMNLLPGSKLECEKGGKAMDAAALSSQGLLQGDALLLQSDMEGTLTLHPDWQVKYRYIEPWVTVLTEEQRQIVATYSRRAESTPQEKMGRTMIILFLVLTIIVLTIYDLALKPDRVADGTLEATLAQMRTAQRVEAVKQEVPMGERDDEAARLAAEAAAAEAAAQAAKAGATTGRPGGTGGATAAGASSLFGVGSFDPNAVVRNPVAITTTREFVAASRGGGGGGGTGPGGGAGGSGYGRGGGTGGGMASSFDPNAIVTYQQSEFASASNVGGLKGTTARPTGQVDVRGNISAAEVAVLGKPIAVTSSERAAISRIAQRAPAITENTIASAPPEQQSDMEALKRAVNSRKSQLTSLYRKTAAVQSSGGSVNIKIYGSGSRIEAVEVIPVSGNLPTSFLNEIKQAVSSWSVSGVSGAFNYTFTIRFG
ncbi:MAG: hypothetical protein ACOYIS_03675 [Candidatus Cloacimonadaceae bacterium]|jgi:hypothetical protein